MVLLLSAKNIPGKTAQLVKPQLHRVSSKRLQGTFIACTPLSLVVVHDST